MLKSPKQFVISFNGLSKKVLKAAENSEIAKIKFQMSPTDRFAKKAVTTTAKTLRNAKMEVFKLLARDLEVKIGIKFDDTPIDLVPKWQVPLTEKNSTVVARCPIQIMKSVLHNVARKIKSQAICDDKFVQMT